MGATDTPIPLKAASHVREQTVISMIESTQNSAKHIRRGSIKKYGFTKRRKGLLSWKHETFNEACYSYDSLMPFSVWMSPQSSKISSRLHYKMSRFLPLDIKKPVFNRSSFILFISFES